MIPFPFNENRFSFFVAHHLLVGQLCTNPKSDRSLLSYLKVTQCSTGEIGDAPLYNSCSLPIQVMTTGPLPAPSKCKSGRFNVPRVMKTKFPATVMVFGVVSSEGHIMPPHIFEVGLKVNTKVWWSPGVIRWPVADPGCGSRTRRRPTSPKSPRLGFRRSATTLYPSLTDPLLPRPEPAGLLRLVISREHHQHDLPQHQNQPDRRHPPNIRRAPTGACGKGMLLVPDPCRGGDWGYNIIKLPELIFSIKVLKYSCRVIFFRTTILSFHPVWWS